MQAPKALRFFGWGISGNNFIVRLHFRPFFSPEAENILSELAARNRRAAPESEVGGVSSARQLNNVLGVSSRRAEDAKLMT
jgi:hypothetical protein